MRILAWTCSRPERVAQMLYYFHFHPSATSPFFFQLSLLFSLLFSFNFLSFSLWYTYFPLFLPCDIHFLSHAKISDPKNHHLSKGPLIPVHLFLSSSSLRFSHFQFLSLSLSLSLCFLAIFVLMKEREELCVFSGLEHEYTSFTCSVH